MTHVGGAVHAFRLLRNSTTKATDHELQKYDIFTRHGHNMLAATNAVATFETLVMGAKAGLDTQVMLDVINVSSGRNSAALDRVPQCVLPRPFPMRFATSLLYKDVRLCVEEADWTSSAA
jgi:3-hydroxyisobutyrate dehydrogenase-like beta-hydroxyacid dehydrogenase